MSANGSGGHRGLLPSLAVWIVAALGCAGPDRAPAVLDVDPDMPSAAIAGERPAAHPDPSHAEVPLPTLSTDWMATLVYESDVGIWTVGTCKPFTQYGCPDVFGLDDKGRCTILTSYSGKWTPWQTVADREWLGAFSEADLDPRVPGREIYTGGKQGRLYQIVTHVDGSFDTRVIASFPGEEIHTTVAGELLPSRPGRELLVFTRLGEVYDIAPEDSGGTAFRARHVASLGARVRQAVLVEDESNTAAGPWMACARRDGIVALLRLTETGIEQQPVAHESMGCGRIAVRSGAPGSPAVLYVTRDDGVILRFERIAPESWSREIIYAGPQGARGIAAGHFDADPEVETVAVFGYGRRVQILSRRPGRPWAVETIFEDRDKGHWLSVAELDGRNGTDELLASGYGKRIVLLTRPPGYGLDHIATDPDNDARSGSTKRADPRARDETLVTRDAEGHIVPALASSWRWEDEGRSLVLTLREGARFHDGSPVRARDVATHFRRWVGLPEHAWLASSDRIRDVVPLSDRELRLTLSEPCAVLPDLCAINPCAVAAPATFDRQGAYRLAIGSGPFRLVEARADEPLLRYERMDPSRSPARIELSCYDPGQEMDSVDALLAGRTDAVIDDWACSLPRVRLVELGSRPEWTLEEAPGSSVVFISFRLDGERSVDTDLRRRVAACIDRAGLIEQVECGRAEPCLTWAAPGLHVWPRTCDGRSTTGSTQPALLLASPLRLLVRADGARQEALGRALRAQLDASGLVTELRARSADGYAVAVERGAFDLRIEQTWGLPYDPELSLASRFGPSPSHASAVGQPPHGTEPRLAALVGAASREIDASRRALIHRRIQELMDTEALIVPLYAPHRMLLRRADIVAPRLGHDPYQLDLS